MPKVRRPQITGPDYEDDDRDEAPAPRATVRARDVPYSVAWFRDRVATYALGTIICGAVMLTLAAWMGGSLGAFGQRMNNGFNVIARWAGLAITDVHVNPEVDAVTQAKVREAAQVAVGDNIVMADPYAIRDRVQKIDSIGAVSVRRLWPDRIDITVEQREPVALWQEHEGGTWRVIDQRGRTFAEADPERYVNLPHIIGQDAAKAAATLVSAMAGYPDLSERMEAAYRINGRRWDVSFRNGADARLPDDAHMIEALDALNLKQAQIRVLDLPATQIDARHPKYIAITPIAGAPEPPPGGA